MLVNDQDVLRVAAKQFGPDEQQIINVYFWRAQLNVPSVTDDAVMVAVSQKLDDLYEELAPWVNDQQQADEIDFFNITQDRPMGSTGYPTYEGGSSLATHLPAGCAALLTATTTKKRVIPKKFFGIFTEMAQEGGEWVTGVMTSLAIAGGIWWASIMVGEDGYLESGTWRRLLGTFTPLVTVIVKALCSYQRRRKPGVGS